jgi:hypothetical protein
MVGTAIMVTTERERIEQIQSIELHIRSLVKSAAAPPAPTLCCGAAGKHSKSRPSAAKHPLPMIVTDHQQAKWLEPQPSLGIPTTKSLSLSLFPGSRASHVPAHWDWGKAAAQQSLPVPIEGHIHPICAQPRPVTPAPTAPAPGQGDSAVTSETRSFSAAIYPPHFPLFIPAQPTMSTMADARSQPTGPSRMLGAGHLSQSKIWLGGRVEAGI